MKDIKTKDLKFVKFKDEFAEQCHNNFFCEMETAKYVLWKPTKSIDEAKEKLNFWKENLSLNGILLLIKEFKSNKIIGYICADEIVPNVYGNVGIALGQNFIKKGYGSQALNTLIEIIKNKGGKEIIYSHFKENEASKRLALKFGFKYFKQEKRIRKYDKKEFDELFYVLKLKNNQVTTSKEGIDGNI